MKITKVLSLGLALALAGTVAMPHGAVWAQAVVAPADGVLLDMGEGVENRVKPTSDQVTVARSTDAAAPGLLVTIKPGPEGYPGLRLIPNGKEGDLFDLSKFGHVEAKVTNLGEKSLSFAVRVDNPGKWQDNPWDTELLYLKPGATGTVNLIFGYQYGHKPGYPVKPGTVNNIMLFAGKSDATQSFRVEFVKAAGPAGEKPPVDPNSIRIAPKDGVLFGNAAANDAMKLEGKGVSTTMLADRADAVLSASKTDQVLAFKLGQGRFDLRQYLEVHVKVKNTGAAPVALKARIDSSGGPSKWFSTAAPVAPGANAEIVIPFDNGVSVDVSNPETGKRAVNNAVTGVTLVADGADTERAFSVTNIQAVLPPAPVLPAWVGKKPPVDGDWVKTFDEEFSGNGVDKTRWNTVSANFWDKRSHSADAETTVGGGLATLHYEKKTGHDQDDPAKKETDYAMGYLDTYGKWTQRYGYFEARMKLPTAPGLWPAFWMMPDRGLAAGPEQWKRAATDKDGMEFDIMEHLTGWGPYRYNIANHYDGYGKDHKANGNTTTYLQPDKDGYITCGLLWTPGSLVYYGNGKELLRWENPRVGSVASNFILYFVSGGWDNLPLDDAKLPAEFKVDYVRAWQRKDLASDVDLNKLPMDTPAK